MAALATPSSSAMALRAAFGDRKPPDISRKITACVACRKLKIKCQMPDAGPPCDRCRKRDLSCTVNRSLQQVLESDLSWKDTIEERLALLESSVSRLTGDDLTAHASLLQAESDNATLLSANSESIPAHNGSNNDEQQTWEVVIDTNGAPAAVPASVVSEIATAQAPQKIRSSSYKHSDLISRGILNIQAATSLFGVYYERLDHFLYSILGDHRSLEDVRKASPTLTNSICAVAALHTGGENYAACRSAFIQQVLSQVFSKKHTADDIRGLVIGAFWLSDMSWALIGLAVRIANEINLNRSFVRPKYSSREWYLNARLYLLVHVCDRHFSIVYGRAPMSETFHNLGFGHEFLKSEHACEDDARLFSQVEIWSISYRIYRTFGVDTEAALPKTSLSDFRRIGIALDTWRADWEDKFAVNQHVGSYPRKGVSLHFDFAKLYLYSHAYRGVLNIQAAAQSPIWGLDEFALHAVSSAEAIVRAIVTDPEIQGHVNGLPTYFHTMIAFAVVFLLKVVSNAPASMRVDKTEIMSILAQMSDVLQQIASTMRKEHIMCSIARSIQKLIEKANVAVSVDPQPNQQQPMAAPSQPMSGTDFGWLMSPDNSLFVGNFDLTQPGQELDFNFMDFGPMS